MEVRVKIKHEAILFHIHCMCEMMECICAPGGSLVVIKCKGGSGQHRGLSRLNHVGGVFSGGSAQ